ncbi:MAG: FAD-dependent oxidoreductase, partial [Lachnospiraceae bacterium]|nr:FAD-dependent oxidoreductase [Lachnospiraceae bacterium]
TTTVSEFIRDKKGNLKKVVLVTLKSEVDKKTGRRMMVPDESTKREVPCQLVLIAAGFLGSESYVTKAFGVDVTERTNVKTGATDHKTSVAGVFTAGDMHTGQSLVVKAIAEGRACAAEVDAYLMGYTNL